jgi:selenide,water dikinase
MSDTNIQPSSLVRLTQTVQKGGCAAKISATDLRTILEGLTSAPEASPQSDLLIGSSSFDDAAVVRFSAEDQALVQTLDFFTPIVDTPRLFGRIAAANALSDVYAMGGEPVCAMGILAFPSATLPLEIASEVLRGAVDILSEAGIALVGGHSIDDDTLKFGLSVSGRVNPKAIWSNNLAAPGDDLILTKALGTGTLTAALKRGELKESDMQACLSSMSQLNRIRDLFDRVSRHLDAIRSATDITGYGLLGHSLNMSLASGVDMELFADRLPRFDRVDWALGAGHLTKAHRTNRQFAGDRVGFSAAVSELDQLLTFDPQTSGGLLLSVAPDASSQILSRLKTRFPHAAVIGRVFERGGSPIRIRITKS